MCILTIVILGLLSWLAGGDEGHITTVVDEASAKEFEGI